MAFRLLSTVKGRKVGPLSFPAIRRNISTVQKLEHEPKQLEELAALKRRQKSRQHA